MNQTTYDIPWFEWKYFITEDAVITNAYWRIMKYRLEEGYYRIWLRDGKRQKHLLVHRIIALLFCENPHWYKIINHKNWIKTDIRPCNLEWCTYSHNLKEAYRMGFKKTHFFDNNPAPLWAEHPKARWVIQYWLDWVEIRRWWAMREAFRNIWVHPANIKAVCTWRTKTAGWFIWKFL